MILFEASKNKKFLLAFLTIVFMFFVIWRWWQIKPWGDQLVIIDSGLDLSSVSSTTEEFKNSLEVGQLQLEDLGQALKRQQQEEAVLKATKDYLNNLSSSTASTTSSSTASE